MSATQTFLAAVHRVGEKGYELKQVYRRLQEQELFLIAYGNLYANQGALTPGVDGKDTVDGMSLKRIEEILHYLATGEYKWQPLRRVEIPKKNGKKRPLGIPGWRDKLLQEVLRIVLETYYEPQFSPYSHGFRPNRGCHTALTDILHTWKATKWFIELDIEGCFNNINHALLLDIIGRQIKDNQVLKLLRTMVAAGYLENWQYHQTYSGTPQGGVISPLLANIYLNELDRFVEHELLPAHNRGEWKAANRTYIQLSQRISRAKAQGKVAQYKRLCRLRRTLASKETHDATYRRLRYIRYADDVLLGFDGPKQEAIAIKEKLATFLQTLHLKLSAEKTLITHAATQHARFLAYNLSVVWNDHQLDPTFKRRARNGQIRLSVPRDVVIHWKRKYSRAGKPRPRHRLTGCSDFEIVKSFGIEFQGLVNYFALAHDVSTKLYPLKYVAMQALAKTIAYKHRESTRAVYKRYRRLSTEGMVAMIVQLPNPHHPDKPYTAQFGNKPIRTQPAAILTDVIQPIGWGTNELVRRLLANRCELCGSTADVQVHHVHKLADVRQRYKGRKHPPPWAKFMMERHRKTIVVCRPCHLEIHSGQYDGRKVN
jgi:group II intron reverse transcriptase/maturase